MSAHRRAAQHRVRDDPLRRPLSINIARHPTSPAIVMGDFIVEIPATPKYAFNGPVIVVGDDDAPPITYPDVPADKDPIVLPAKAGQEDKNVCIICTERRVRTVCVPCGHSHSCITCVRTQRPTSCPVCRKPLTSVIRLFPE